MGILAARLSSHGAPIRIEEVDLPEPGPDEVRVELQFGGINPVDSYVAQGTVAPDGPLPRTLGGEAAGTLEGRPVIVTGSGLGAVRDGVWAQAAVVPAEAVIDLPAGVDPRQAAAMGVAGLTAYNVVHALARVGPEDRALVLGASGGVGSLIVSLLHTIGATVWGQTGSAEKRALIEAQGADRVVIAGPEDLAAEITELEPTVIFDPLGDGFLPPCVEAGAPAARIVSFGVSAGEDVQLNLRQLYRKGMSLLGYAGLILSREERRAGLEATLGALAAGDLRVVIDEVLPLAEVNSALQRLAERNVRGKLLLSLQ